MARHRAPVAFYAGVFANFMAIGMYLSALQRYLPEELGTSKSAVGLAVGVFFLAALFVRPPAGRLLDRTGPRPFLLVPLAGLVLTSLAFEFATTPGLVIALRVVQGGFGAAFYLGAASLATELGGDAKRATALAWFSLAIYAGFALGPGLGELIVDRWSVGAAWLVAAGWWVVALVAMATVDVPARPAPTADADVGGGGGADGVTVRKRTPIVHRTSVLPGVILASITIAYVCVSGFSVLYADRLGLSGGAMYFTFAVSVFAVRLVSGGLADRVGRVQIALPGLVAGLLAMLLLAAATPGPDVLAYVGTAMFGAGHGLVFPALMAWAVDRADPRERGAALGSFSAFGDAGQAVGGWGIGRIVDAAGFPAAYLTGGALCLVGALALLLRPERPSSTRLISHRTSSSLWPASTPA